MRFYVYRHIRLDTGLPFYVGKGKGDRAYCHHNRNAHWRNISARHGFRVEIVTDGLDEELAFLAEIELIDKYSMINIALCNMTKGGDGVSLVGEALERFIAKARDPELIARRTRGISSPEVQERRAAAARAALTKPDVRARIAEATRRNNAREEVRSKISASARAYWNAPGIKEARLGPLLAASKNVCARGVVCVKTGIAFQSMADAVRWLRENGYPKASHSAIVNACKGKLGTVYGSTWRYADAKAA